MSEALTNLRAIAAGMESFRAAEDFYPKIDVEPSAPLGASMRTWDGRACPSCTRGDRRCNAFDCIGFSSNVGVRYSYVCEAVAPTRDRPPEFTCAAVADLDDDGRYGVFVFGTNNRFGSTIVAPLPAIAAGYDCAVDKTFANEVVDCNPGVY